MALEAKTEASVSIELATSSEATLLRLPNAFVTPHLAGSQGTELGRMAELVLEELRRFAAGEPPLHPVTAADLPRIA